VSTPVLYVKRGCPYCATAIDYLDKREIAYEKIDVRGDRAAMTKLEEVSGQTRTPTLVWDKEVLSDFDTDQLEKFLSERQGKPNGRPSESD
jgi:glutaredoxin 3